MRVFVAGATRALGRRIVPALLDRGHRVTAAGRSVERLHALGIRGADTARLDLLDAPAVARAVAGDDAVINVATRVPTVAALDVPAGIYNVVDDEPMTRDAVASTVARLLGAKPPKFLPRWVAMLAGSLGETLARSQRVSNAKLRQASGWAPSTRNARVGLELVHERNARRTA